MKAVFISIFPELIESFFSAGVINKASKESILDYDTVNPIKFLKKNERLDDASYGGGPGMLIRTEPFEEAIKKAKKLTSENTKVINLSPQGKKLTQKKAKELSFEKDLIFVCGRYEGIDQRLIDSVIDEEISIGDYVVTGGELPALIVFETIVRNIKGVLGDSNSISEESFSDELLEYPQYTRPEKNNLGDVPKVLLSGNHKKKKIWRKKQSLGRTFLQRRDIFPKALKMTSSRKAVQLVENPQLKKDIADFSQGDTVLVDYLVREGSKERFQPYEGVVIAIKNRGLNSSFTVRKISNGVGVERTFQTHSPLIKSIKRKRKGKVRQSKLFYLRERSGRSARIKEKI